MHCQRRVVVGGSVKRPVVYVADRTASTLTGHCLVLVVERQLCVWLGS